MSSISLYLWIYLLSVSVPYEWTTMPAEKFHPTKENSSFLAKKVIHLSISVKMLNKITAG